MDVFPWIIVSIVVLGVIVGLAIALLLIRRRRGIKMTGAEYRTFFIVGIAYLVVGITLSFVYSPDTGYFNFFTFMGIIFTAMGLANIDKWRKKPG